VSTSRVKNESILEHIPLFVKKKKKIKEEKPGIGLVANAAMRFQL